MITDSASPMLDVVRQIRCGTFRDYAYDSIRHAMLTGELRPEVLYSEAVLARQFGASRTPVREALRRLEVEGLVDVIPQRGFRLRTMTLESVREFYVLRGLLETYVIESLCAQGLSDDGRTALARILDRQRGNIDDVGQFIALDEEFHVALATLANLPRTASIITSLRGILWRLGTPLLGTNSRRSEVLQEHNDVLDALRSRDCARASKAMKLHLDETARLALTGPISERE